jgi:hypothetical protein
LGVLVRQWTMAMCLRVALGQMESETDQHRHEGRTGRPSAKGFAEKPRHTRSHKWGDREEGCRTRCPDAPPREQIQA